MRVNKILPYTRRLFISYSSFYEKAAADTFHAYPKELPPGAKNTRYFYYTGSLDKVTEISFTLNEEEYQELKETYLPACAAEADKYQQEFKQKMEDYRKHGGYKPTELFHYVFNEPVTSEFLKAEHLDYLRDTMQEEAGHYTMLVYCRVNEGGTMFGVFFNDENRELVLFNFQNAGKNGRLKNN